MTLYGIQKEIYEEHGEAIVKYGLKTKTLARDLNVTEWTVRQVKEYLKLHGPPKAVPEPPEDDAPGTILVIGDAHAKPGESNRRFTWLGRLIMDVWAECDGGLTVVCIGDLADMESLSSYDVGKRSFEGRRYRKDIDAAIDAQEKMFAEISDYARKDIRWVYTEGNHEHRISRATNDHPALEGLISLDDLRLEEFGWEVYRFKEVAEAHGIGFSHYFASGVMGRAISGVNIGRSLVTKCLKSVVQGHSHLWNHYLLTNVTGERLNGLSCGCYFEHDEEYASSANKMFWRGIAVLRDAHQGEYDLEQWSMARIRRKYDY
jgi:hypothetical protein